MHAIKGESAAQSPSQAPLPKLEAHERLGADFIEGTWAGIAGYQDRALRRLAWW
jgi:hypothetical protein